MFVAYAWADLDYWAAGSGDRQEQSGNIFTADKKVALREKHSGKHLSKGRGRCYGQVAVPAIIQDK